MSNTNDIFQVDYLPEKKEIRINLPEEVWKLVVEKQKESEVERNA